MRLLLDTHVFLWASAAPDRLGDLARAAIEDPANDVLVSAATAWEVAIKRALGTLTYEGDVATEARRLRFSGLPISLEHAAIVEELPALHRDPFDRMLVGQAVAERATIVTRDSAIEAYDVPVMAA